MTAQLITLTGNLTGAPELRFGPSGVAVCRLSVACQDRYRDAKGEWQDGETHFQRCTAFGAQAENIAASMNRGNRVVLTGRLVTSKYQHTDAATGETADRYSTDFHIEDAAASVKWATVRIARTERATVAASDPWSVEQVDALAPAGASSPF